MYNEYPAGRPTALLCTVRTGARRPFCPAAAVPTGGSVPGTTNVVLIFGYIPPGDLKVQRHGLQSFEYTVQRPLKKRKSVLFLLVVKKLRHKTESAVKAIEIVKPSASTKLRCD